MRLKRTILSMVLILTISGCSSLIYSIRGPKYKDKFDLKDYPFVLDSTSYYQSTRNVEMLEGNDSVYYNYIKFKSTGVFYGYTSSEPLNIEELNKMSLHKNYFDFENGFLKWEVYHDSYNGYNLFKAKVYKDSIVAWQVPYKKMRETYYKLKQ